MDRASEPLQSPGKRSTAHTRGPLCSGTRAAGARPRLRLPSSARAVSPCVAMGERQRQTQPDERERVRERTGEAGSVWACALVDSAAQSSQRSWRERERERGSEGEEEKGERENTQKPLFSFSLSFSLSLLSLLSLPLPRSLPLCPSAARLPLVALLAPASSPPAYPLHERRGEKSRSSLVVVAEARHAAAAHATQQGTEQPKEARGGRWGKKEERERERERRERERRGGRTK